MYHLGIFQQMATNVTLYTVHVAKHSIVCKQSLLWHFSPNRCMSEYKELGTWEELWMVSTQRDGILE